MPSLSSSASVPSMQKWGIPGPESSVLERLVWVRYGPLWWPAVLYQSYMELQEQMYTQFSSYVVKAQFALAIMRQMQEKRNVQVARLLGRSALEIVEVEEGDYHDFYFSVADLLPEACDKANYDGRMDLFLDVHRALDEVEEIFREVTNDGMPLFPNEQGTWLERAQAKLHKNTKVLSPQRSDVSVNSLRRFRDSMKTAEGAIDWSPIHKERSNTMTLQPDMTWPNTTIPSPVKLSTVHEEPSSSGGHTRYMREPTVSQEKLNDSRTRRDILNSTIQIGGRETSAASLRTDRSAVPTDELAQIRRNRVHRSTGARFSSDELLRARYDKLQRLKSIGVSTDEVQRPLHDRALFRGRGESFSTPSHATCPPVVNIPSKPQRSMESTYQGTKTDDRSEKRGENPSPRGGSSEIDFQARDPPTKKGGPTTLPPQTNVDNTSRAKTASTTKEVPHPPMNLDLPHQASTDTLQRERYTPVAREDIGNDRDGNASVDSATVTNLRTPSAPRQSPLGAKSSTDANIEESKGRKKKVTMSIPPVQKVNTGISRAETEKAGNLSDYLPASPSLPNASSMTSGGGGDHHYTSKDRPYRAGVSPRHHGPPFGHDRMPPSSQVHSGRYHHGGPPTPSLLMEAKRYSHETSLQLAEREPRVDLPFCGFRMIHQ